MHGALMCDWAFGWMWLRHSIRVEFERRSLVKPLCKTGNEHIDINRFFRDDTFKPAPTQFTHLLTGHSVVLGYTTPLIYTLTMKRLEPHVDTYRMKYLHLYGN